MPLEKKEEEVKEVETAEVVEEEKAAPVAEEEKPVEAKEEEVVSHYPAEPRLRYRGKVVVSESERTVGTQTFKHIRLDSGEELDILPSEYAGVVYVAYPPVK